MQATRSLYASRKSLLGEEVLLLVTCFSESIEMYTKIKHRKTGITEKVGEMEDSNTYTLILLPFDFSHLL